MNKRNFRQVYITPEMFRWHFQTGSLYEGFVIGEGYAWVSYNCMFVQDYITSSYKTITNLHTSTGISYEIQHLDNSPECVALSLGAEESLLQPDISELPPRNSNYEGEVWGNNDRFLFVGTIDGGWECYYKGIMSRKIMEVLPEVIITTNKKEKNMIIPSLPNVLNIQDRIGMSLITGNFRHLFGPDAVAITIGGEVATGVRGTFQKGILLIRSGKDIGIYNLNDLGVGFGTITISGSITITEFYSSVKKIKNIKKEQFYGGRINSDISITAYDFSFGKGYSFSSIELSDTDKNNRGFVIGSSYSIGLDAMPFNIGLGLDTGASSESIDNLNTDFQKQIDELLKR